MQRCRTDKLLCSRSSIPLLGLFDASHVRCLTSCTDSLLLLIFSLWSPTVQITFAHFDGKSRAWRSVNVSHFTTPPSPSLDKRSSKGDNFSVTLDPKQPDCYKIQATYDKDTQLTLNMTRSPNAPGFKLGTGPRGGISYFGTVKPEKTSGSYMPDRDAGHDGYAVHRFWPSASVSGVVRIGQTMLDLNGSSGIFIHAVQGRRPNLLASRWNFADFQCIPKSPEEDQVSLIMMEFTTTAQHKHRKVNVGSVVVNGELVAITIGGSDVPQGSGNEAAHQELALDKDTGYNAPNKISFEWTGPAIADRSKTVKANVTLDASQGLAEKVDVLAEIPYFIKKVVNVVSGAKPYVYQVRLPTSLVFFSAPRLLISSFLFFKNQKKKQWFNPREATIELPELNGKPARTVHAKGYLFNETSYVSEDP